MNNTNTFILKIANDVVKNNKHTERYALNTDDLHVLIKHQIIIACFPLVEKVLSNLNYINALLRYNGKLKAQKQMLLECIRINRAFDQNGIRYLVIKGIPLSIYTYGAYDKREYSDIDYVIFPDDAQQAHDILYSLGYLNLLVENGSQTTR